MNSPPDPLSIFREGELRRAGISGLSHRKDISGKEREVNAGIDSCQDLK